MSFMNNVYLLTGGNMGDRLHYLQKAYQLVESKAGTIVKKSSIYETAAWGFTEQQAFLNQVLCIDTTLEPGELLQQLLAIELHLGRERLEKMGPRLIDIDILFFGNENVSTSNLVIPHPRIAQRRFVLTPLNEIASHFIHPVLNKTIHELLSVCTDQLEVKVYSAD
jgi:2-amino-4-hydroxy-6-hydroxymethyldihydropteridine diphosphokinase